jgi:hypothetical protein
MSIAIRRISDAAGFGVPADNGLAKGSAAPLRESGRDLGQLRA